MECMDFYHRSDWEHSYSNHVTHWHCRYGRDGANYTSRAIFDCYYNENDNSSVVIDYQPKRTLFFLLLWSVMPGAIMFLSCVYMCVCSKFMFIGDDGHMRIFCCGKAVTGKYQYFYQILSYQKYFFVQELERWLFTSHHLKNNLRILFPSKNCSITQMENVVKSDVPVIILYSIKILYSYVIQSS